MQSWFKPSPVAPSVVSGQGPGIAEPVVRETPSDAQTVTITMPGFLARAKAAADSERGYSVMPDGSIGHIVG